MNPVVVKKHDNCPVKVEYKQFRTRPLPVPGLYCARHGTWIKWLSEQDYQSIQGELNVTHN